MTFCKDKKVVLGVSVAGFERLAQLFRSIPTRDQMRTEEFVRSKLSELSLEDLQENLSEMLASVDNYLNLIEYYQWNANKYLDPEDKLLAISDKLYEHLNNVQVGLTFALKEISGEDEQI